MKHNYPINNFSDLEREEIRLKMRLKKQEEVIKIKLKTLPEEIVTAGASKLITGVLSGNFLNTAISIIKTVGSSLTGNNDSKSESGGIMNLIKTLVKAKLSS
ncbi:MAG: hypothetical protein K0S53_1779 [Bacteroidetes bacterium]|jgi:hypothetical protein|nr:hypothetical protein [Bacteroidota bacterium]MDF2453416.1 hypothetical protein [Bacteroidota bacterium]